MPKDALSFHHIAGGWCDRGLRQKKSAGGLGEYSSRKGERKIMIRSESVVLKETGRSQADKSKSLERVTFILLPFTLIFVSPTIVHSNAIVCGRAKIQTKEPMAVKTFRKALLSLSFGHACCKHKPPFMGLRHNSNDRVHLWTCLERQVIS